MDAQLEQILENWKNNNSIPIQKRDYRVSDSKIVEHEFVIVINIVSNLKVGKKKKQIRIVKFFHTFAQSRDDANKTGDTARLENLFRAMDDIFEDKLSTIVTKFAGGKR